MAYDRSISSSSSTELTVSPHSNKSLQQYPTDEATPQRAFSPITDNKGENGTLELNEGSPLLSPVSPLSQHSRTQSEDSVGSLDLQDVEEAQPSKSIFYLFILTLSIGGLQISWATELSNGSPYLQSLGMSKSLLSFVWMAGPLAGVLVQPYIGIRSDNCRLKWGKRTPFMVGGALATAVSFLCLAWTREIVYAFLKLFGADTESSGAKAYSIIFAIIWVYVLDFAINTVQAGIRAFIVDNAPLHQQEDANAWASRITGVGNILGYLSGYVHLPKHFPWLGHTQMQVLCAISSIAICSTVLISVLYIRERDPNLEGPPTGTNPGILTFFSQTFRAAVRMPPQIRKVCIAQFFNWLGWFGFLFYQTTYIGQIKLNPYFAEHPDLTPDQVEDAWEDATRYATFALLIFAITSFLANTVLPFFVRPTYGVPPPTSEPTSSLSRYTTNGYKDRSTTPCPSPFRTRLDHFLSRLQIEWLTLRRAWLLSHLMFVFLMASTFLIHTPTGATALTAFIGIPWAVSLWAPFALISAEISKRDTEARRNVNPREESGGVAVIGRHEDQAGVILGLHNVAVALPQMLATLVSSIIFKLAQKPRGTPYDTSTGWVLRLGGLTALAAAFFTYRVAEEGDAAEDGATRRRYERVREGRATRDGGEV
ncbi:MAG: hypothetical protein Q9217_003536 [Psora testacea]